MSSPAPATLLPAESLDDLPLHALLAPGGMPPLATDIRPIVFDDEDPLQALVAELRNYQHELELQNEVLNYSQAVAESASERFETLFASIPLPLLVVDEYDMVVQANDMAYRAFQPTENDRLLVNFQPFVNAQDSERVREAFALAKAAGRAELNEVAFDITDSQQLCGDLHVACVAVPQQNGPSANQYLCAVVNQGPLLAERKALQERNQQLYASERRLESVINSALDVIICVDREQRVTVFNPSAAALFLCSPDDALGSPLARFLPEASRALAFSSLATQAMLGEMTGITTSGHEIPVEVSVSFEHNSSGTTTVFARDLTSRKRAEAQRSALETQLRESQKMQAVGTMAGGIAHDFNNIVGAIIGNVELAKADCAHNPAALESLYEIEKAGRRARDLVRQILTFSRNDKPERRPVQVRDVMQDTARLLRVSLPPGIELQMHEPEDPLPPLMADPTQVEQALFNLCNNAMQALGEERGSIQMKAQRVEPDGYQCERLGLPSGEYMTILVQDSGPGMDAATLRRIFEPFFTTKPVGQGTGLGLAVVHGVMRTHGGAVDVRSKPGRGSCFTLYFPLAEAAETPVPAASPVAPSAPQPSATSAAASHVMYVDDDQALVFLFQRLLRRHGYQVSGFTDPREAMARLRENPARFDLVVTDYNMPGFSGVDLVTEALQINPALPVALASGYITAEIERAALAAGAKALIHKPNDVQEFCATVHQLLNP